MLGLAFSDAAAWVNYAMGSSLSSLRPYVTLINLVAFDGIICSVVIFCLEWVYICSYLPEEQCQTADTIPPHIPQVPASLGFDVSMWDWKRWKLNDQTPSLLWTELCLLNTPRKEQYLMRFAKQTKSKSCVNIHSQRRCRQTPSHKTVWLYPLLQVSRRFLATGMRNIRRKPTTM